MLITSRAVVLETVSLITKRISPHHARLWYSAAIRSKKIQIRDLDATILREAERLWLKHGDKNWDLVDCCSFVIMRRERLSVAFTFDNHFRQVGFSILPAQ